MSIEQCRNSHVFRHQVDQIVTYLSWGTEWVTDSEPPVSYGYCLGGAEALGHILACWFVQVCGVDGYETAVGRDILFRDNLKAKSAKQLTKLIINELKSLGIEVVDG